MNEHINKKVVDAGIAFLKAVGVDHTKALSFKCEADGTLEVTELVTRKDIDEKRVAALQEALEGMVRREDGVIVRTYTVGDDA